MGVTIPKNHNHRNNTLLKGSHKLGYHASALPQNNGDTQHIDGYCGLGCGGNADSHPDDKGGWGWKLGVGQTYLPDAARAGAEFIQGLYIEKIVIENGVATGVEGIWTPPPPKGNEQAGKQVKVLIRAQRVVLSGGSIHTPALLLRSELEVCLSPSSSPRAENRVNGT